MQTTHVTILVLYLAMMVGIGLWFSRSTQVSNGEDFAFAGRSLPRPVMIGTLLATWVGSGTIIGGASFAYTHGPVATLLFMAGTPLGIIALYFIAKRVRQASAYTVPELLERRYGVTVRIIASMITLLAYTGIVAYQFTGGGRIVSLITPLSAEQGTILVTALVTFLAIGGGLKSVAWSDFASAVIIVFGLAFALAMVFGKHLDGLGSYWDRLPENSTEPLGGLTPVQMLGFALPLFMLILADQNMYQRLAAARDEHEARSSTVGFLFTSLLVIIPVALLGSAAAILLPDIEPDNAVLALASEGFVPTVLGGLILAGALAFIVTTGSSFLLSGAANVVYDGVRRLAGVDLDERGALRVHRLAILGIAAAAYVLGRFFPTVLELQLYSYTVYGVAIAPPVLAIFFWQRASTAGAIASMTVATVVTVAWEEMGQPFDLNAILVSLPATVLTLVVVSLLVPNRRRTDNLPAESSAPAS